MTPAERAIADVLTFRRWWGDAWAFARLEQATREAARSLTTQAAEGGGSSSSRTTNGSGTRG